MTESHDEPLKLNIIGDPAEGWEAVGEIIIIILWIMFAALMKLGFHSASSSAPAVPECCMLICAGLFIGGICELVSGPGDNFAARYFTPHIFFVIILPPIVFDAGFFMPKAAFFDNIGTILTYAIFGTLFNAMAIGFSVYGVSKAGLIPGFEEDLELIHCLLFGSIISAVDPVAVIAVFDEIQVNMTLYICVFGESLLNDGVAVVLYKVFEGFAYIEANSESGISNADYGRAVAKFFVVAGGGVILGLVWGFLGALMTKYTKHARIIEPLLVYGCAYSSYLIAEMLELSSILAIVFCGFFMQSYVEHNISKDSMITLSYLMKLLANIMDITIFMFLGISAISEFWVHWNTAFVIWTLIFISVYRVISVYTLTFLLNLGRLDRICYVDQFIMAYGGLRGGIAFSLCQLTCLQNVPAIKNMLCATIIAVFFTSFVQGMSIKPIVEWLKVKKQDNTKKTLGQEFVMSYLDHMLTGIEDIVGNRGRHWWMQKLSRWNDEYLNPILQRDPSTTPDAQILKVWQEINLMDAQNIVMNTTKIQGSDPSGTEEQEKTLQMMKMILPGYTQDVIDKQRNSVREGSVSVKMGMNSEKLDGEATMHHMLRDNLYANRKQVELQGHLRYRKVNNIDADRISIDMKKQQQEIVMRQRWKSFAARSSVSAGGSSVYSGSKKSKSVRKSSKQYGSSNGGQSGGHVGSSQSHSGVSPLALPSVTDSEQKPKSVSSLPPIADQTELEDLKEDSSLLDTSDKRENDSLPWRRGTDSMAQRSLRGRPKSQLESADNSTSKF